MHLHVGVAGARTERACVALARQPDALAVVDAGRDVDVELALLEYATGALALPTRRLDPAA